MTKPIPNWKELTKPEKTQILAPLMREGYSATEMAGEFIHATRNAIIGRIHQDNELRNIGTWGRGRTAANLARKRANRIKAKRDPNAGQTALKSTTPVYRNAPVPARLNRTLKINGNPFAIENALPGSNPIPFSELKSRQCQWIFGDGKPYLSCAEGVEEGEVYCPTHFARTETKVARR